MTHSLHTLAQTFVDQLTTKHCADGSQIIVNKIDADEELIALAFHAHDGMLPDNHRYRFIYDSLQALAEEESVDQAVCAIEPDIRLPNLTEWLHSNATRVHYISRVQTEIGQMKDGCQLLATAQHLEKMEVFYLVLERLQVLLEDDLDEE